VVDANGNGIGHCFFPCDAQADDAGAAVQRLLLVEDEVADAVKDGLTAVGFGGLQGVGVMSDDDVGAGINQGMGFQPLLGQRAQRVLGTPVQIDDDNRGGIGHFDGFHPIEQRVERLLADALAVGQVGKTFQRQAVGGKEVNAAQKETLPPAPPCMEGSR